MENSHYGKRLSGASVYDQIPASHRPEHRWLIRQIPTLLAKTWIPGKKLTRTINIGFKPDSPRRYKAL